MTHHCNLFLDEQIDYMFLDKIGVPFKGEKKICRLLMLTDDYIFNPNELKQEMSERRSSKVKETKVNETSPNLVNMQIIKDTDKDDMLIPSEHYLKEEIIVKKEIYLRNEIIFSNRFDA